MSARTAQRTFYGWINLAVASVIGVIGGFYLVSFSYFLPFLVEDFGWNRGTVSLAATINLIALGLCGPFAGAFIVRHGVRKALILGNLLGCGGFLMLYFHSHLWQLFLGWGLLVGMGAGFGGLLANTTVINNWFVRKRHLALSILLASGGVGGVIMGPALMKMIEKAGWRTTSLAISLLVLVFAVLLPALMIKNRPQDIGQEPDGSAAPDEPVPGKAVRKSTYRTPVEFTLKEAVRTRCLWLLTLYFCASMLAMGALMTHQVAYLLDIGISTTLAATALSVMSGLMAFGQLSVGFLGTRYSMHVIAIAGEVLKISGMLILLAVETVPFVFLYMVILGTGFGLSMAATMNIFPNYFGASEYPKIMGLVRLFWTLVGGIGAPAAGYIRETTGSYLPAFEGAVALIAVGLACLIFARPPVHPSRRQVPELAGYAVAPK